MVQPLVSDPSLLLLSCNAKKRDVLLNWLGPVSMLELIATVCRLVRS